MTKEKEFNLSKFEVEEKPYGIGESKFWYPKDKVKEFIRRLKQGIDIKWDREQTLHMIDKLAGEELSK